MTRRTYQRLSRLASFMVLISLLATALPAPQAYAYTVDTPPPPPQWGESGKPLPAPPAYPTLPSSKDAHLPVVQLSAVFNPDPLLVGMLTTITLTITNEAAYPAQDLTVTMPVPAGVEAVANNSTSWSWKFPRLGGQSQQTMIAQVRVPRRPASGALLLHPEVHAGNIPNSLVYTIGALVVDPTRATASTVFQPGTSSVLHSGDGQIEVALPADSTTQPVTLTYEDLAAAGKHPALPPAGQHQGWGVFSLTVRDGQNNPVQRLDHPLTLTFHYTDDQLRARGVGVYDLTLVRYAAAQQGWIAVPTDIDTDQHTLVATLNSLEDPPNYYQFEDSSSASSAFIPSLQGWQVGLYTGSFQYSMPINVPAGPGGIRPQLQLSYDSAATDGKGGLRVDHYGNTPQAGWVGKGWSLDTGSIALNKVNNLSAEGINNFTLILNGQSFDLVRGDCLADKGACSSNNPWDWDWRTSDESFMRIRANAVTPGSLNTLWRIWTKDGTLYEYGKPLTWAWETCDVEQYRWMLTKVQDVTGNIITYNYGTHTILQQPVCNFYADVDNDVWPTEITWGANVSTGAVDHYKVVFTASGRGLLDSAHERAYLQLGGGTYETQKLDKITIYSLSNDCGSAWCSVGGYSFTYFQEGDSILADASEQHGANWDPYPLSKKLTLYQVQQFGRADNGQLPPVLPPMTFNYGRTRGTGYYPNGDWNRLNYVSNGYLGEIWVGYDTIGAVVTPDSQNALFLNNRRVTWKVVQSGRGPAANTFYHYDHPAYNWLGSELSVPPVADSPCAATLHDCPNSARLYFNAHALNPPDPAHRDASLAHKRLTEFRGHAHVYESVQIGATNYVQTDHWFYQGDNGCVIGSIGDACYGNTLGQPEQEGVVKHEFLKGREYKTLTWDPAGNGGLGMSQSETIHGFGMPYYYHGKGNNEDFAGLWYAQIYERDTFEISRGDNGGGGVTPKTKHTTYQYDTNWANYGHLLEVAEYDGSTAPETRLRRTVYTYALPTGDLRRDVTIPYIVDRRATETIYDGTTPGNRLAATLYVYDGPGNEIGVLGRIRTKGQLTLVRKMLLDPPNGQTYTGSDTRYGYDAYGNQTTVTTYDSPGTADWSGSTWTNLGAYGSGSTARTTTTTYDTDYHVFREQVTPPFVNVSLAQTATYDKRMGTLLSVTDANGQVTQARYDEFGRMIKFAKPGDDINTLPTTRSEYHDGGGLFHYIVWRLEDSSTGVYRATQTFYDGLGRVIQTKRESATNQQNIVTDKYYDARDQVTKESQPRYVNVTPQCDFWALCDPTTDPTVRWTTTSYEVLGRAVSITTPDQQSTSMWHWMPADAIGWATTTTDANAHKTRHYYDVFGRLRMVKEFSGTSLAGLDNAPEYTSASVTTYTYSPLDLLTSADMSDPGQPAVHSVSTMTYDSLGRKRSMSDADMGNWTYAYDINGNLKLQTDARNQQINFNYDALNRLTGKTYPAGNGDAATYTYDQNGGAFGFGKGRRTTMSRVGSTDTWQYDRRGRTVGATYAFSGLSGNYTFGWAYDSADRLKSITYPATGEVVSYTYDPAWRSTSACSSIPGQPCYVKPNAPSVEQYSALDQPEDWTFGNDLTQHWTYGDAMARLTNLTVGPGGSQMNLTYAYDDVGNVKLISDAYVGEQQDFRYDHRDRLTHAWTSGGCVYCYDETYSYDALGNLKEKGPTGSTLAYTYGYQPPYNGGAHAVLQRGTAIYGYDANGNMLNGDGRAYTWNADNQPTSITGSNWSEQYTYDADGERIKRTRGSASTYYLGGLLEIDTANNVRRTLYTFNGQVVAQRTTSPLSPTGTVRYFHNDHLGSVSLITGTPGSAAEHQYFKPWGEERGPQATTTTLNYTGQHLDSTGLLYYHSRYYDPALARWLSPDTVVPGAAASSRGAAVGPDGTMSNRGLTVDYHEIGFVSALNGETAFTLQAGFWFQLTSQGKQQAKAPWGPIDPQTLNRYSYTLNNPLSFTDATGHFIVTRSEARKVALELSQAISDIESGMRSRAEGSSLQQFIEDIANVFPGPVQALLELFLHAGGGGTYDEVGDLLDVLKWMQGWVDWLKSDTDPGAYLDFELAWFVNGVLCQCVFVNIHTNDPADTGTAKKSQHVGETLFFDLRGGSLPRYSFRIVDESGPLRCACGGGTPRAI